MSFHFAAARCPSRSPVAQALARRPVAQAVNDNGPKTPLIDGATRAALVQFAQHGLASVTHAVEQAEQALVSGDAATANHWIGICRSFDTRRADSVARRLAPAMQDEHLHAAGD